MTAPKNLYAPPIEVEHSSLEDLSENSIFRKMCPVCVEGTLLVARSNDSFTLLEDDRCLLCGQQFIYTDIELLRKKDGV